uniref:COP9 signalosome complex subunit 1 n=1 Tax=Ciona intestinalis TaxID=7719 RepID=F7AEY7_CIOIN|nr:COP9 signalosome complex subunit 1 [Ciona intestinalis]|eukprot:XP_026689416.1 COP9 signalosome complex subunit 1 [Ciona intestinalis]
MPLPTLGLFNSVSLPSLAVEPMQVDGEPEESNEQPREANFTVEAPTLDLDAYASSYSGIMRIERLVFVATHAPTLRVEALRMACAYVKKTINVTYYQEIHEKLVDAMRNDESNFANQIPTLDQFWVEQTSKHASTLLEKLDIDLKNCKSNSIKESIRRGFDDLGSHYLNMGDLSNALKCYSRARDYCTCPKHIVNMCLNVIKVCVYLGNWSHVLTFVNKAEAIGDFNEKERDQQSQAIFTKLKCAAGLAQFATGKFKMAAKSFLQASVDHCDFPELLSPNNVAVYGSLCALATFSREELQASVISSSSFKLLLELEPTIREIVFAFYKSQYGRCLLLLQSGRDNHLLDLYLSLHLDQLIAKIRCRALIQYFSPYKLADMQKMATAFNCSVNELEDELMPLILDGQIQARIDSQNKILHARDTDDRSLTFARTLDLGKEYLHRTKALILRNAVIRNNISVQIAPSKDAEATSSAAR